MEQILDAVSVYVSTELLKNKKDLTEEQYSLLNNEINSRLERKLKTIIGYRVVYYRDKALDEVVRLNLEKILMRIHYAVKHRALYK